MPHYYQIADVFVSASDSESQGLTYDESLASDVPIVVRRSEYTDQLIDDPGIGMSFQKRADLVKGILHYIQNPPVEEAKAKREQKLHDISAEVFGRRVVEFYEDCQMRVAEEQALKQEHRRHLFHHSRRF